MALGAATLGAQPAHYHVSHTYAIGGDGSWDYVILDTIGQRLFVGRQNRVMVIGLDDGKLLGEVPGLKAAHGTALDYPTGRGFATSGADSSVVMFDLKTLEALARIPAAEDADAVLYDPVSKRVFTFNGDAHSSTVIDPASGKRVGTVALGGKPEYGVSAGDGKVYANLTDTNELVEIDAKTLKVTRRWPTAPCTAPVSLAIDRVRKRLFSGCRGGSMAVSDIAAGKIVATVPIGPGVDATAYDPATRLAMNANVDGTVTVIHQDTPDKYTIVETVKTMPGAKTMALDPRTHRLYTVSAKFGPLPDSAAANPRRRPPVLPGTFVLIVLEP
jgi:DNA-binding beta-propeller fold protein YncE